MELQKKFENLAKWPKRGGQVGLPQPNWALSNSSITNARSLKILLWMLLVEVIIFGSGHFFPPCSVFWENPMENANFSRFLGSNISMKPKPIFNFY
jgi:hypothetical protein